MRHLHTKEEASTSTRLELIFIALYHRFAGGLCVVISCCRSCLGGLFSV